MKVHRDSTLPYKPSSGTAGNHHTFSTSKPGGGFEERRFEASSLLGVPGGVGEDPPDDFLCALWPVMVCARSERTGKCFWQPDIDQPVRVSIEIQRNSGLCGLCRPAYIAMGHRLPDLGCVRANQSAAPKSKQPVNSDWFA